MDYPSIFVGIDVSSKSLDLWLIPNFASPSEHLEWLDLPSGRFTSLPYNFGPSLNLALLLNSDLTDVIVTKKM